MFVVAADNTPEAHGSPDGRCLDAKLEARVEEAASSLVAVSSLEAESARPRPCAWAQHSPSDHLDASFFFVVERETVQTVRFMRWFFYMQQTVCFDTETLESHGN